MPKFQIQESGKNGSVEILDDRIIRVRKKLVGKKDIQTIPVKAISGVHHDRKTCCHSKIRSTPETRGLLTRGNQFRARAITPVQELTSSN